MRSYTHIFVWVLLLFVAGLETATNGWIDGSIEQIIEGSTEELIGEQNEGPTEETTEGSIEEITENSKKSLTERLTKRSAKNPVVGSTKEFIEEQIFEKTIQQTAAPIEEPTEDSIDRSTKEPIEEPNQVFLEIGEDLPIVIHAPMDNVIVCYIITPSKEKIEFISEKNLNKKYEFRPSSLTPCAVTVKNIDENDNGLWILYSNSNNNTIRSISYELSVIPQDSETTEKKVDDIIWLNQINHVVVEGTNVDIALSKKDYEEECYLRTPNNQIFHFKETEMLGIIVHSSSNFVSCRITIPEINTNLTGIWTLCGKHVGDYNIEHERCQLTNITLAIITAYTSSKFDHVVNFGGILTPVVSASMRTASCHVITPLGEDLIITPESDYPGINRAESDHWSCSVAIGPIDASLLGDWVLYGTFFSFYYLEERFPMNLRLYNENEPYEKAYNVTVLEPVDHVVNLGNTIQIEITSNGNPLSVLKDDCMFTTPLGQTYSSRDSTSLIAVSFIDPSPVVACRISIGPITEYMLGEWQFRGKFNNSGIFTERQLSFNIIREDPANPIQDERRAIENLQPQYLDTKMNATHAIVINGGSFLTTESCHIRTPDGLQYTIMEGFNIAGVTIINEPNIACGVNVTVLSEDLIGEWELFSRDTRFTSDLIERRLTFTIYVEEHVNASSKKVVISNGNDLYIRLVRPTELYNTCKLISPEEDEDVSYELDTRYNETCGFIIRNLYINNSGIWEIRYGERITFRAFVTVTVNDRWVGNETKYIWVKDRPVNVRIGPEDAVYCRIEDPQGFRIYDGFGKCDISLQRVTAEHDGVWKMLIGFSGRVLIDEYKFVVNVREAEPKRLVQTHVSTDGSSVILSCSVQTPNVVRACKFREPSGRVLLASHGVGEDRYIFQGVGVSFKSEVHDHDCGLRITNPTAQDLGLWRCAIDTDVETYYGFLTVLCSWAMSDIEIAATIVLEPRLLPDRQVVEIIEGEAATMSCSIQSALRYCYFRAPNGTVYNLSPGISDGTVEYLGTGLDAGDCGINIPQVAVSDRGFWSCHVGFNNVSEVEQWKQIDLTVIEEIVVDQYRTGYSLNVIGFVYLERAVEYCRFVRIDGLGFTTENLPDGYANMGSLERGQCHLIINEPTTWDHHPWTVVAKIRGQGREVSSVTRHTIELPSSTELPITTDIYPEYTPMPTPVQRPRYTLTWLGYVVIFTVTFLLAGLLCGPKRNRDWTYTKTLQLNNRIRNSFRKKQIEYKGTSTVA